MEEKELIIKAKEGSIMAFNDLLYLYENRVFGYCMKVLGNRPDALDATQETFIKFWKNLDSVNEVLPLKSWIFKIATNTCFDILRKRKNTPILFTELEKTDDEGNIATFDPPDTYQLPSRLFKRIDIENAISKVRDKYRVPIVLFYVEDMTYENIAETLNIPLNTVKSLIFRGRKMLVDELEKNGENRSEN